MYGRRAVARRRRERLAATPLRETIASSITAYGNAIVDTPEFEQALKAAYAAGHEAGLSERAQPSNECAGTPFERWLQSDTAKGLVASFAENQESARTAGCAIEWATAVIEARRVLLDRIRAHLSERDALEGSGFEIELAFVIDAMKPRALSAEPVAV